MVTFTAGVPMYGKMVKFTVVTGMKTRCMDLEYLNGPMVKFIMGSMTATKNEALEFSNGKTGRNMKALGWRESSTVMEPLRLLTESK